jgi:hypothetical protein
MTLKAVRKITIKSVYGPINLEKLIAAPDRKLRLLNVLGIVRKLQPGETDKGPFVKMIGDFKATNLETGEVFRSGACILPNFVADMIVGAMDTGRAVQFAFEIQCRYSDDAISKYVYDVISLLPPSESDELAMLEKTVSNVVSLPSPDKSEPKLENKAEQKQEKKKAIK